MAAILQQEVDFYEAIFFSLLIFKKKRQILLHFNHSYSKSSNRVMYIAQFCYYDP